MPVSTTPGPLLGAHHLCWGRQLRGREGGSCEELAGAGDHYCSASYYRRFIQGFSKIAGPLHDLVAKGNARHKKKGVDISKLWDQQHQKAFEELKTTLTTAPVQGFAEFTKPSILETDASHDGLLAILCQDQDGQRRVLAYASRQLRPTEKN